MIAKEKLSRRALSAAAVTLAVLATLAQAQVQQIQQGRILDANPQVGSGGSNRPVQGYVPINSNDIIYGNVAGLSYFHAPVGSSSPLVFQAPLGSATLQNFARQSAPMSPGGGGPSQVYYFPSTVVSTAQGNIYSAPMGSGFDSRLIPQSAVSPTVTASQLSAIEPVATGIPMRAFDRTATSPLPAGVPGTELTSPLFALRVQPIEAVNPGNPNKPEAPATTTMPAPSSNETSGQTPLDSVNDTVHSSVDPRTIAMNTGEHNNTVTPAGDVGDRTRVSAAYLTLQSALAKAQADETLAGNPGAPSPTAVASNIDPLTHTTRVAPDKLTPDSVVINGVTYQSKDPSKADYLPRAQLLLKIRAIDNQPASTLRAGRKVKPLKSLAETPGGGEVTPFDKLMKTAEDLFKQEKYLDAADAYQSALVSQPDNPLAAIGRAHAELGAGMYQSAGFDLKFIFTKKPELISVHYPIEEFIPPARLHILLTDLADLANNPTMGNNASFLYCYLAYNTDRTTELQQELDRWATRPWHDTWQAAAAKAWGSAIPPQ